MDTHLVRYSGNWIYLWACLTNPGSNMDGQNGIFPGNNIIWNMALEGCNDKKMVQKLSLIKRLQAAGAYYFMS